METKNSDETVLRHFQKSLYKNHFSVPPSGLSGGLMLSWKDGIKVDVLYSDSNIIDTKIQHKKSSFFASFIYGAPKQEDRPAFWSKLSDLSKARDSAWLLTGDFNDLLDNTEKVGGPLRWEGSFLAFRSFVSQSGLWDLPHAGNHLSWRGVRHEHFIQSRLDRAMANCSWSELFPAGRSIYLRFEGSDHRPILTLFDQSKAPKKGSFRFDRRLRKNPDIHKLVEDHWPLPGQEAIISKTDRIRRKIMEWTREQNTKSCEVIREIQSTLEAALSASTPDPVLINSASLKLEKAYLEEEEYWQQRSRIQWLQCGDRNSGFFHAITRGRRQINNFSILEDDEGNIFDTEEGIVSTISQYFRAIFSSSGADCLETVEEALTPCISDEDNAMLTQIPDKQEVTRAVFAIHADKAPGPDGFSAGFYHSYWDIVGDDIFRDIREFFETGYLHPRQNETHVRLIAKITAPRKVADFRPIALCTTHYKIIAKILTMRLQPLLPHIISPPPVGVCAQEGYWR